MWIGIDPGRSGASVCMGDDGELSITKHNIPDLLLAEWFQEYRYADSVVIEQQWSRGTDSKSSAFKLATNYGILLGCIASVGMTPIIVSPQKWQRAMQVDVGGDKKEKKAYHKQVAAERFPHVKATLYNCDALLIVDYAKLLWDAR